MLDITLQWMLDQAVSLGLKLYDNHGLILEPNPREVINNSRQGWAQLFRRAVRHLGRNELNLPPQVHASAFERGDTTPWIFGEEPVKVE